MKGILPHDFNLLHFMPMAGGRMRYPKRWQGYALLLFAVAIVLLINPVGLTGGGNDNARYFDAARCWREQGFCIPHNHWAGRWPVFAPIAPLTFWFGESRFTVGLWPLIASVTAAGLLAAVGERLFDRRTGLAAAFFLIFVPFFAARFLTPSAEAIELSLLLGAILTVLTWRDRPHARWAFLAGLLFGLAFQVRETSLVATALAAVTMLAFGLRPRAAHLAWAALGFLLPLAIEFATYHYATGDMFFRRHQSLMHARIYSSELAASVDTTKSPLLNPEFIAGWRKRIYVHWLIDGPINLLVSAGAGFALLLAPLLLAFGFRSIGPASRRATCWLLGLAAAYIAIIIYVLGMDPKPRVMLPAIAAASLALAVVSFELLRLEKHLLIGVCWVAAILGNMLVISAAMRPARAEQQARAWMQLYAGAIETDRMTRSMLTLLPEARALPGFESNRRFAMIITKTDCRIWRLSNRLATSSLAVESGRRLTLYPNEPGEGAWICLFRYRSPMSAEAMRAMTDQIWRRPAEH